ncbi:MAG: 30S ribosomal protein S6 [Deltaproteobacteria bacterium]|nr:30S ribosomal protein S6 [Deltaproteobacteria bacterium]
MRIYEMVLITSPELSNEGHEELLSKIGGILKKKRKKVEKGEILNVNQWGVRRLSVPIEKSEKGRYDVLTLKCLPDTLSEVERNLRLSGDVLRFQTIRLKSEPVFEKAPEQAAETAEATEEAGAAAGAEQ